MEKTNEILTIAGRRVEVRLCEKGPCDKCCFFSHDCGCPYDMPCFPYWGPGYLAYFVPAEEIEGTPKEVTLIPSNEDEDEAAEMAARCAYPYEGGTKGDICEASIPIFCKGFKAGIAYERERLMKGAVQGEVVHINGFPTLENVVLPSEFLRVQPGSKVKLIILK